MAAPKHNLFSLGKRGRPLDYKSPEEMEVVIDEYFNWCISNKVELTITGLGLFLGFSCRETLDEYGKRPEFSDIVKRGKYCVENAYELNLHTFKYGGAIFALKNMGWKDQQEQNITQTITTVNPQVINSPVPLADSEQTIQE